MLRNGYKSTNEEFVDAIKTSQSIREVLLKLNLRAAGGNYKCFHDRVKELNVSIQYTVGPRREGDPRRLVANSDLAKQYLNFKPKHNLNSILKTAYHWHERHRKSTSV